MCKIEITAEKKIYIFKTRQTPSSHNRILKKIALTGFDDKSLYLNDRSKQKKHLKRYIDFNESESIEIELSISIVRWKKFSIIDLILSYR